MAALLKGLRAPNAASPSRQCALIKYTPWNLHSRITLERPHALSIVAPTDPTRTVTHPTFTQLPSGSVQLHLYIERILSRQVAVVGICSSTNTARWIVKFVASDWASRWHLHKELGAYAACESLQGTDVPVFYGEWRIVGTGPGSCSALLMEYVVPGTTIASLRGGEGWEMERKGVVRAAVRTVENVNRFGVAHNDLGAENMIVAQGRRVVVVGFGWASVGGYTGADRWSLFQMGFLTTWDVPELV